VIGESMNLCSVLGRQVKHQKLLGEGVRLEG